jgi:hypothetical protein
MTEPHSDPTETDPEARQGNREVVTLLQAERPVPAPGFRGALRRKLLVKPALVDRAFGGFGFSLRTQVASTLVAGTVLLAIAALGLVGAGPFAA